MDSCCIRLGQCSRALQSPAVTLSLCWRVAAGRRSARRLSPALAPVNSLTAQIDSRCESQRRMSCKCRVNVPTTCACSHTRLRSVFVARTLCVLTARPRHGRRRSFREAGAAAARWTLGSQRAIRGSQPRKCVQVARAQQPLQARRQGVASGGRRWSMGQRRHLRAHSRRAGHGVDYRAGGNRATAGRAGEGETARHRQGQRAKARRPLLGSRTPSFARPTTRRSSRRSTTCARNRSTARSTRPAARTSTSSAATTTRTRSTDSRDRSRARGGTSTCPTGSSSRTRRKTTRRTARPRTRTSKPPVAHRQFICSAISFFLLYSRSGHCPLAYQLAFPELWLFLSAVSPLQHACWLIHRSFSFLCRSRPFAFFKIHFLCFRVLGVTPRRLFINAHARCSAGGSFSLSPPCGLTCFCSRSHCFILSCLS